MKLVKLVLRLVSQFAAALAVQFVGGQGMTAAQDNPALMVAAGVLTAVLGVFVYRLLVGRMERRQVTELSAKGALPGLVGGTLGGLAIFGLVIVDIACNGGYQVHGLGTIPGAVGLFGFMAAAAATEELMYRGVLFRIIEERTGTWISLVVTGLVFGMSHLLNPDADLWGALAVAIEAGGMLTAAYVATRKLWVPIGLHFGWNFAAGGIFSTQVSGNGTSQGLLNATTSGPDYLTGGAFGPEGSVISVGFCVVATIAFMWVAYRRGNVKPIPRRRQSDADQQVAAESDVLTKLSR
ncbi:type II CAAX endopeptidase family protein [Amycolatopsis ultiminotia]|uniref:Type II CAAX endopeptidase family protein n=1 Tax=Amycolatopsis ultiminotia TaxID=543629 RepID=A0ABP6WMH6_9PSEU